MKHIHTSGHIKWYSQTQYVDDDTGEQLKEQQIKDGEYRIIKTSKQTIINNESTRTVIYTKQCRSNTHKQTRLF